MAEPEARITLRLPAALKADIEELAQETRRSINAMLVTILERAMNLEPFIDDLQKRY